jgi:hypothetical protein
MKYYVYISDAKVDMLLPQISDSTKKKISMQFGFDLKVLTAKRTSEFVLNDDRIARLETVVAFIREWGNVGSMDEPDEYVEDTLPMRTSTVLAETLQSLVPCNSKDALVYFAGHSARTHFGLAGSFKHIVGVTSPPTESWPSGMFSAATFIAQALRLTLGTSEPNLESVIDLGDAPLALACVHSMAEREDGPEERLEFMAKRLLWHSYEDEDVPSGKRAILLASPLYVAKAD